LELPVVNNTVRASHKELNSMRTQKAFFYSIAPAGPAFSDAAATASLSRFKIFLIISAMAVFFVFALFLQTARADEKTVKITWFGHSMFLIEFESARVLIDPFSDIGYPMPLRPIICDICIVSHKHADHSNLNLAGGAYALKDSEGFSNAGGIGVDMIKSYHDRKLGADRGINYISVFNCGNVRFAHLGDLGSYDDKLLKSLGRVDVLMIPVGGYYTIDAYDAWEIVRYLGPKIIFPMHYKTEKLDSKIPIDTAEKFISGRGNIEYFENGSCEIKLNDLPKEQMIYMFRL